MILGPIEVPDDCVEVRPVNGGLNLATEEPLEDIGRADPASSSPQSVDVQIYLEGNDVSWRAAEIDTLLNTPTFAPVAVAGTGPVGIDGYYVASNTTRTPRLNLSTTDKLSDDDTEDLSLSLEWSGSIGSHLRALETNPNQNIDHEYGNDTSATVALPSAARNVQWRLNGSRSLAAPTATKQTAYGDVELYNLEDSGYTLGDAETPTLLFELDKQQDAAGEVRVFDTRSFDTREVDGERVWQRIFSRGHEAAGEVVMDNGLIRLRLDEAAGTLEAEEWDSSSGSWTTVGLEADQPSTVSLFDVDLTSVAMVRDQAQLTFDVDGSLFALNAIVHAGWDTVQFSIPAGETGPVPADLESWLEPIASTSVVDPNASKTLISRNEVRR
ncbi:hypothetical protein [Halopiger thermotolerans]